MRVLVTGGYGFIGSFVAEKFFKEGYEVSILDNLSSGDKSNVNFKHNSFILSVEDRNCEEIFRNNKFDIVIHLAAQVSVAASIENPYLDTQTNILGITNMLSLSQKYGTHKFLFASSAAVYGDNIDVPISEQAPCKPISPYGMNKWVGEAYCDKWREIYNLETLCFRFSNVYGPRQGNAGEGGVISIFLERIKQDKILFVYGDGQQSRDFIYVEDVAEAIYRAALTNLTGTYNLSTNTESTINEVIEIFRGLHGDVGCLYKEKRAGDIERSRLDNQSVIKSMDWAPKTSLTEGLGKTYQWYFQNKTSIMKKTKKRKTFPWQSLLLSSVKTLLPYAENLVLFILTAWLTVITTNYNIDFIDFKLLYIIVMGTLYGNRQSMVAVALSCSYYTYTMLANGRELVALLIDPDFFLQCAVYLFIGLVIGYAIERKQRIILSKDMELQTLKEKYEFLDGLYNDTRMIKDELRQQILNNGDSFGKIYQVTKELESLEPEKIFISTIQVVESIMKSNMVSIYTVNKYRSFLRLAAKSNHPSFDIPKSLKVDDFPYLRNLIEGKQLYVNKELQGDFPLLAAPVISHNGEIAAVISVHRLQFEHFTQYHQNLFKTIVDLISTALSRSLYFVESTSSMRYWDGTMVLKPDVFKEIIKNKNLAREKQGAEYVVLQPASGTTETFELAVQVYKFLRETDYVGTDHGGQLKVLLSNTSKSDASFVLNRMSKNGISLEIVGEELLYA